ncbi:MAG: hypothetical protein ACYCOU_06120 [Sulfobacillus sp.]
MKPLFLPKLKDDHKTPPLQGKSGTWHAESNVNLLETIADDLDVGRTLQLGDTVSSVPSIFARPWLFAQALQDDRHPLHSSVKGEWRGLLGIFCFQKIYGFSLLADLYSVPLEGDSDEAVLVSLLNQQLPLTNSDLWRRIWLIKVGGQVLGGTSPLSGFFTGIDYDCPEAVPWRVKAASGRRHILGDVTSYLGQSSRKRELGYLRSWLEIVRQGTGSISDPLKTTLRILLDSWLSELKGCESIPIDVLDIDAVIEDSTYRIISRPAVGQEEFQSDVRLVPTEQGVQGPLILAEQLLTSQTRIIGPDYGDAFVLPSSPHGTELRTKAGKTIKQRWLRPELSFFSDSIIKLNLSNNTVNRGIVTAGSTGSQQGSSGTTFTLPLTPTYFEFFTNSDVRQHLSITAHDDRIHALLKIPLSNGAHLKLERTYKAEAIHQPMNMPSIEVWPNFQAPDWHIYYLYCSTLGQPDLDSYTFAPIQSGTREDDSSFSERGLRRRVWEFDRFPGVIACSYDSGESKVQSGGVIAIGAPPEAPRGEGRWNIGIDFGTANTGIAFSAGQDDPPKKLTLQPGTIDVCADDPSVHYKYMLQTFFPSRNDRRPVLEPDFPTLFMALSETERRWSVLHGIAYFHRDLSMWDEADKRMRSNLKWAGEEKERAYINVFLEHLVMMILAEARRRGIVDVNVQWSYPSSFRRVWLTGMRAFWSQVASRELFKRCGSVALSVGAGETESVACARYLAGQASLHGDTPAVCVDIGGGSTDIAVWRRGKLEIQTSIKLGGNDILGRYGKERPGFVKYIKDAVASDEFSVDEKVLDRLSRDKLAPVINALLQSPGSHARFRDYLHGQGKSANPDFKHARSFIFVAISGILFYIGMLLKYLRDKDAAGWVVTKEPIVICFGGRGSQLVEWILPIGQQELQKSLASFTRAAMDDSDLQVHIQLSAHPKEEVVRGLVLPRQLSADVEPMTIIGEEGFLISDAPIKWSDSISASDFARLTVSTKADFGWLRLFVKELGRHDALSLRLPSMMPPNLRSGTQQAIADVAKDGDDAICEPLFIIELKLLLEYCLRLFSEDRSK